MRIIDEQKSYFSIFDERGRLLEKFFYYSNLLFALFVVLLRQMAERSEAIT